ncbi:hypothetical protein [Deinococcus sp. UYEF24]
MINIPRLLIFGTLVLTAPSTLATSYFQVPLGTSEATFARAARSMGYQLDTSASSGDTHHYKNLATGWDAKVELALGKITSYTVSAPYDVKYPATAQTLKRLLGKPWREGHEKLAWLVPQQAITTFKQSWIHYEIKTVSLLSSEGQDLKTSASEWTTKAAVSTPTVSTTRQSSTPSLAPPVPVRKAYPNSDFQESRDAQRYCLDVIAKQLNVERVNQTRGGSGSAVRYEVAQLKSWVWKPMIRVSNTEYTAPYHCNLFDNGKRDIGRDW